MDRTLFASEEDSQVPHIWGTPDAVEIVTKFISLICISILSVLFGIKIYKIELRYLTYSKWLVLALYVCSWAFSMTATLLASTNDGNETSCTLSQLTCDLFYSGSKFIIYVWLIEKVWIVSGNSVGRWKSPTYIFHMCLLIPYIGIMAIMIYFKISGLDPAGVCTIGLSLIASIPLLIFDFLLSSFMSILFIKPLFIAGKNAHDDWRNSRLHGVAVRSFVASIVGLLVSFVNILVLILFPQGVRDILCFTCCTIDVTINVITIHWVTAYSAKPSTAKKPEDSPISEGPGDTHGTTLNSELIRTQNSAVLHFSSELRSTNNGDEEYALSHIPIGIVADGNEQRLRASYITTKSTLPRNQMDNISFDSYNYSTHETIDSFTSLKDDSTVVLTR